MNPSSLLVFLAAAATATTTADAFVVVLPKQRSSGTSTSTSSTSSTSSTTILYNEALPTNRKRVKKAGGGVPFVPSGDRGSFWDPASEGMRGMDGDYSLDERLAFGTEYLSNKSGSISSGNGNGNGSYQVSPTVPEFLHSAQCWLEDIGDPVVPPVFATPKAPVTATVLGRTRLIDADAPGDIQHVVLKLPEGFRYVEGQSLSVIPPGKTEKGKPHKPRLYSIASTRYGDLLDGSTVSLCVRRAEFYDPSTGQPDPAKAGVCSKFLCDATAGTTVNVAGPVGKTMVLPEDPSRDIIMVATGTGIAPFRSFLHRLFIEHTPANHLFNGRAWLILGVPTTGSLLYKPEFDAMLRRQDGNDSSSSLRIDYAISREMTNAEGGKLYVQDLLKQNAEELFKRLEGGAVIYFCGLKGMMPGILDALEEVATQRGLDWGTTLKRYQSNHQWHVEVY